MNTQEFYNFTIKSQEYVVSNNKTLCVLKCKLNLKEFERQHFTFTNGFIRRVIGRYLPIVKSIYGCNGEIVAKYYIEPGCDAKILKLDKNYLHYKKGYSADLLMLMNVGDYIPLSKMVKHNINNNEYTTYDYTETIKVCGASKCHPDDEFSLDIGKLNSANKAYIKASERIGRLYVAIAEHLIKSQNLMFESVQKLNECCSNINNQ